MAEEFTVVKGEPTELEKHEAIRLGLRGFLKRCTSRCNIEFTKGYAEKGIILNHSLPIFAFNDFASEFESNHRLNKKDSRRKMGVYVSADHNAIITSPRIPRHFIGHEREMMSEQIEVFNTLSVLEVALKESLYSKGLPVGRIYGFAHNVIKGEFDPDLPSNYKNGLFYMLSERGIPLINLSNRHGREELYQKFKYQLREKGFDYYADSEDKYQGLVSLNGKHGECAVTIEPELIGTLTNK